MGTPEKGIVLAMVKNPGYQHSEPEPAAASGSLKTESESEPAVVSGSKVKAPKDETPELGVELSSGSWGANCGAWCKEEGKAAAVPTN